MSVEDPVMSSVLWLVVVGSLAAFVYGACGSQPGKAEGLIS
jgi:hypothetical protein